MPRLYLYLCLLAHSGIGYNNDVYVKVGGLCVYFYVSWVF